MAVDFIDCQLVVAAFPYLKAEWGLSDTQLGTLVSVVSVTVALGAFPTALLADRWSRVKAIAVMGTTWSLATLLAGACPRSFRRRGHHRRRLPADGLCPLSTPGCPAT